MSRDDSASPKAACLHLAGERAKIGAGVGTAAGFMRRNQERRRPAQVNKQAMAQYQADLDRYSQAFAPACRGADMSCAESADRRHAEHWGM